MLPKNKQYLLDNYNNVDPHPQLGTFVDRTKNAMVVVYDFDAQGGATGTLKLLDDQGNPAIFPQGAIITNVVANVITDLTSGGLATVSLGLLTTTDLLAATNFDDLTGFVAGVPVGTAASWVGPVTATEPGSQITATIGVAALTAGKVYFNIEYVINSLT